MRNIKAFIVGDRELINSENIWTEIIKVFPFVSRYNYVADNIIFRIVERLSSILFSLRRKAIGTLRSFVLEEGNRFPAPEYEPLVYCVNTGNILCCWYLVCALLTNGHFPAVQKRSSLFMGLFPSMIHDWILKGFGAISEIT